MTEDNWDRLARDVADGRISRRRAFRTFAAGAVALSAPWAFPRRALAADCGTYCAGGGGCQPPTSGCCCFQTGPGTINVCGCYNPDTEECVYIEGPDGGCVVRDKPGCPAGQTQCDDTCCTEDEECLSGVCVPRCPAGTTRCADQCCQSDEVCLSGVCVPGCPAGTKKCGGECCKSTQQCCGGERCCPKDGRCCGGICCKAGESCCKDECCKEGDKCVDAIGKGDVTCCSGKRLHKQGGRTICCPRGTVSTASGCCPKDKKDCCGDLPPLGKKKVCVKGKIRKI